MKNTIVTFLIGLVTVVIIFLAFIIDLKTLILGIIALALIGFIGALILGQIYAVGMFIKSLFDTFIKKE